MRRTVTASAPVHGVALVTAQYSAFDQTGLATRMRARTSRNPQPSD